MKKVFLTLMMVVATCAIALAGNPLKVTSGSLKELKSGYGKVYFEYNFDKAQYDKKMPLENHYTNLAQLIKISIPEFNEEFEDEAKNYTICLKESEADYIVYITVENMDSYYRVWSWGMPGYETKIWGTIKITRKDGSEVASIYINELDGGGNPNVDRSFVDAFDKLGEELGQKFKKGK